MAKRILKDIKNAITKNKSASILFCFAIGIFIYSLLILFDYEGPTAVYDTKPFRINGLFNDQPGGFYTIITEYKSKGVISSNKDIEFFIYGVQIELQKEQFKYIVGERNIWPDNITMEFCPEDIRFNGDSLYSINPCINGIKLVKASENNESILYNNMGYNIGAYFKYDIEFVSSGQKALVITSLLPQIHEENVFQIEPYSTYLQIQLQKYTYILALLAFIIILFQIYEFVINHLRK
ncbi:MAG: hypothetical protein WC556_00390 [Candidatus Methanoperedens sp.]